MAAGSHDDKDLPVGALGSLVGPSAVKGADSIASSSAVASVETLGNSPVESICHLLSTGTITPAEAQEHLIDSVVREQLGPLADPALEAEIRKEIAEFLAEDPTLARLLDPRR